MENRLNWIELKSNMKKKLNASVKTRIIFTYSESITFALNGSFSVFLQSIQVNLLRDF